MKKLLYAGSGYRLRLPAHVCTGRPPLRRPRQSSRAQSSRSRPKAVTASTAKKAKKQPAQKRTKKTNRCQSLFGQSAAALKTNEPTTTEIYSDEAFFDSTKNMGTFSGRVKVTDPRFNLQSDKLTVFITKGENQGLEKAIAEGNVGLVRERPDPSGGPPTRAVGRADKAIYTAATGDVELQGTPRVQEGANMHVATSPDTVMIINQNSQLGLTDQAGQKFVRNRATIRRRKRNAKLRRPGLKPVPAQTAPAAALPTP